MEKNSKNLLSISGRIGSGKDLLGKIFQALLDKPTAFDKMDVVTEEDIEYYIWDIPKYEVKKFADKLKDMVCILLDCTREQLENREFKEKELEKEWWYWKSYTEEGDMLTPYLGNENLYPHDDGISKLTPRLILQLLGTQCGRDILHPNIWVNALMGGYLPKKISLGINKYGVQTIIDKYPSWIITDTRFPNEFEAVKSRGGVCIKIERIPKIRRQYSGQEGDFTLVDYDPTNQAHVDLLKGRRIASKEHESETALDNQTFDYVFLNNGSIKDLVEAAKKFLRDYEYIK